MDNFEFFNPVRVIFGAGKVSNVGEEAIKLGKRVLLVSYQDYSFFEDLLDNIKTQLESQGITVISHFEAFRNGFLKRKGCIIVDLGKIYICG